MSDEDTLMKELYTIKQGTKESVKHFDTWIGYAMMRFAAAFHMPCLLNEQKLGRPTSLVGYVLTLSPLWPGKCAWMEADGR